MKPDGGPAFPQVMVQHPNGDMVSAWDGYDRGGASLRDYFAAAALQAMHGGCAEIFTASLVPPERVPAGEERAYVEKRIAALAGAVYAIADAMLAERSKA